MSTAQNPLGKGIGFPPRVGPTGRMVWSEGERDVEQSIGIILRTDNNERIGLPGFGAGLSDFLFEPNNSATHARVAHAVQVALKRWEPRITVDAVEVDAADDRGDEAIATIAYRLVATGDPATATVVISTAAS